MQQAVTPDRSIKTLSENQASEVMWEYYRDHKAQIIADIKEFRAFILAELMQGIPAEQIFAQYARPPAPVITIAPCSLIRSSPSNFVSPK